MELTKKQSQIVKIYAKLAESMGKYPARSELIKAGVSRDAMRAAFGDMESLKKQAKKLYPEFFDKIIGPEYFTIKAFKKLEEEVQTHKRFVITTAVAGAPVDENFLASIKKYCEHKKALLLVLPANYALYDIDRYLVLNERIVFKGLKLNSNISISPVKIDPKQIDPTVNLDSVGQREGTILLASPKQRMRPVANSNTRMPHRLQATGAITKPRYIPRDGVPKRRDFLATKQHVMGAIIVETVDNNFYHFRQIQAAKDGSFTDLFHRYSDDGVEFVGCEAIIQGDYHNMSTDPLADAVADELCRLGKPKYRIFHDLFDGMSINHHEKKNKIERAILAAESRLSLATEIHELKLTLQKKLKIGDYKIVITKSNHDEFLIRYLQEGDFEDQNRLIATKLQVMAMEGKDPLKAGLEELYGFKNEDRVIWLSRDQDFKITRAKIEVGCHGDLGPNGKRGPGSAGMLKAYGDCSYGHCHYAEINHGAMSVGTSSYLKLKYNRGPSSWTQTHQIVNKDGSRQLINCINGKYCLEE